MYIYRQFSLNVTHDCQEHKISLELRHFWKIMFCVVLFFVVEKFDLAPPLGNSICHDIWLKKQ